MLVVRNVFQLKYGKAKEAKAAIMEFAPEMTAAGMAPVRFLTDLTGQAYRLILESSFENLAAYEEDMKKIFGNPVWSDWYQKFVPLVESSYREILTIVDL